MYVATSPSWTLSSKKYFKELRKTSENCFCSKKHIQMDNYMLSSIFMFIFLFSSVVINCGFIWWTWIAVQKECDFFWDIFFNPSRPTIQHEIHNTNRDKNAQDAVTLNYKLRNALIEIEWKRIFTWNSIIKWRSIRDTKINQKAKNFQRMCK